MPHANSRDGCKPFHGTAHGSIEYRGPAGLLDFLKEPFIAIQEFFLLTGRALRNVVARPHYGDDVVMQMDLIGVGSLPIVILTGLFAGAVMALQMSRALSQYGQVDQTDRKSTRLNSSHSSISYAV